MFNSHATMSKTDSTLVPLFLSKQFQKKAETRVDQKFLSYSFHIW